MKLLSKQDLVTLVWAAAGVFVPGYWVAYYAHTHQAVFVAVAISSIASFAAGSYVAHQNYTE